MMEWVGIGSVAAGRDEWAAEQRGGFYENQRSKQQEFQETRRLKTMPLYRRLVLSPVGSGIELQNLEVLDETVDFLKAAQVEMMAPFRHHFRMNHDNRIC